MHVFVQRIGEQLHEKGTQLSRTNDQFHLVNVLRTFIIQRRRRGREREKKEKEGEKDIHMHV